MFAYGIRYVNISNKQIAASCFLRQVLEGGSPISLRASRRQIDCLRLTIFSREPGSTKSSLGTQQHVDEDDRPEIRIDRQVFGILLAEIATWPKLTDLKSVTEYLVWNQKEMQPDYIKLMHESGTAMGFQLSKPSVELQKIVVTEANKRGLLTVAHALSLQDTLEVLEAGVNGLTHTICDQPPTQELVDAYKKRGAWLNPTLAAIGSLTTEGQHVQERFAHDARVQGLIGEKEKGNLCKCMAMAAKTGKAEYAYESVKVLRKAGIDIVW